MVVPAVQGRLSRSRGPMWPCASQGPLPLRVRIEHQLKAVEGDGTEELAGRHPMMSCLEGKMACRGHPPDPRGTRPDFGISVDLSTRSTSGLQATGCGWRGLLLCSEKGMGALVHVCRSKSPGLSISGAWKYQDVLRWFCASVITRSDGTKSLELKCAFYEIPKYSSWSLLFPSSVQLSIGTVKKKKVSEVLVLFSGGVSVFVCIRETEQRDRQNMRELDAQRDIQSLCQWDQEFKGETGRPPPVSRRFSICELGAALACYKVRASSPSFSSLFPLGIPGAFFIAQHSARGCTGVSKDRSPGTILLCMGSGPRTALSKP